MPWCADALSLGSALHRYPFLGVSIAKAICFCSALSKNSLVGFCFARSGVTVAFPTTITIQHDLWVLCIVQLLLWDSSVLHSHSERGVPCCTDTLHSALQAQAIHYGAVHQASHGHA